ncbi:MAG: FAD-dependent thymidylate synthase [Desulfotomaculum sp.]|nr:FAD-dependent thymidylate synthase [Desulfotomaculum sp.]
MKIIQPYIFLPVNEVSSEKISKIERYGRVCYKSENLITKGSANTFVEKILNIGHESVIEHEKVTVLIATDRGVTHEIVRHRIGSYSQESTRYCNYQEQRFGKEITVIKPFFYNNRLEHEKLWIESCEFAEKTYFALLKNGFPQEARAVLPNSLKTEIVVTYNFREWRHFFKLRCAPTAHPQMQQIAIPLLLQFKKHLTPIFEDIKYDRDFPVEYYAQVVLTDHNLNPV